MATMIREDYRKCRKVMARQHMGRKGNQTVFSILFYIGLMIFLVLCLMVGQSRADVVVSEAEIHAAVTGYVHDVVSDFAGETVVKVLRQGDLHIAGVGAVTLRVRQDRLRSQARSIPVVLEVVRGPVVIREYQLIAEVQYFDDVVVANRAIERGETIAESAVVIERRDVTMLLGKYYARFDQVDAMQAKMRIGMGRPLSSNYLEAVPLVERGDMVRILAQVGGITATITGIARDSGSKGDHIVVQNAESREKLLVEVIGPGKVRVVF